MSEFEQVTANFGEIRSRYVDGITKRNDEVVKSLYAEVLDLRAAGPIDGLREALNEARTQRDFWKHAHAVSYDTQQDLHAEIRALKREIRALKKATAQK